MNQTKRKILYNMEVNKVKSEETLAELQKKVQQLPKKEEKTPVIVEVKQEIKEEVKAEEVVETTESSVKQKEIKKVKKEVEKEE